MQFSALILELNTIINQLKEDIALSTEPECNWSIDHKPLERLAKTASTNHLAAELLTYFLRNDELQQLDDEYVTKTKTLFITKIHASYVSLSPREQKWGQAKLINIILQKFIPHIQFFKLNPEAQIALANGVVEFFAHNDLLINRSNTIVNQILTLFHVDEKSLNATLENKSAPAKKQQAIANVPTNTTQHVLPAQQEKNDAITTDEEFELVIQRMHQELNKRPQERIEGDIELQDLTLLRTKAQEKNEQSNVPSTSITNDNSDDIEIKSTQTTESNNPIEQKEIAKPVTVRKRHPLSLAPSTIVFIVENIINSFSVALTKDHGLIKKIAATANNEEQKSELSADIYRTLTVDEKALLISRFFKIFRFELEDSIYVFKQLSKFGDLPAHIYLVELMDHLELLSATKTQERMTVIKAFFAANTQPYDDHRWVYELFVSLYEKLKLKGNESAAEAYYYIASDIIKLSETLNTETNKIISIPIEPSFIPFARILKNVSEDLVNRNNPYYVTNIYLKLIEHIKASFAFQIYAENTPALFEEILSAWTTMANSVEFTTPTPMHVYHGMKNNVRGVFCQFTPETKNETDVIAYMTVINDLLPLLHNENQFMARCHELFSNDMTNAQYEALREKMIAANGIPSSLDEIFKSAVQRRINLINHEDKPENVNELLNHYFEKEVEIVNAEFDAQSGKLMLLNEANDKPKPMQLVRSFIDGDPKKSRYHFIVRAEALLESHKAKKESIMGYESANLKLLRFEALLSALIQRMFNSQNILRKLPDLVTLPKMLLELPVATSRKLIRTLLIGSREKTLPTIHLNKREAKQEEALLLQTAKVSAIFRALANAAANPAQREKIKAIVAAIPELHSFEHLDYKILFNHNMSARFYERFERPAAKACLIQNAGDPHLASLYQMSNRNQSDFDLIHLFGKISINKKLIDSAVLNQLVEIQQVVTAKPRLLEDIYNILGALIQKFDTTDTNIDEYKYLMELIHDTVFHLVPLNKDAVKKQTVIDRFKTAELTREGLHPIVDELRDAYPLETEIFKAFKKVMDTNSIDNLKEFIGRMLQQEKLHLLIIRDYGKKHLLPQLFDQLNTSEYSEDQIADLLEPFMKLEDDNQNLNSADSNGHSWLLHTLQKRQYKVVNALIKINVNVAIEVNGLSFLGEFLKWITKYPDSLEIPEYESILLQLFNYNGVDAAKVKEQLSAWLAKFTPQQQSESDLESKSDKPALSIKIFVKIINKLDRNNLREIALALIDLKHLELLSIVNSQYKMVSIRNSSIATSAPASIWLSDDSTKLSDEFKQRFEKSLNIPERFLKPLLEIPGFFTARRRIFASYFTDCSEVSDETSLRFLSWVLSTCDIFNEEQAKQFCYRLNEFSKKLIVWSKDESTKTIADVVYKKFDECANQLFLSEITNILMLLTGLKEMKGFNFEVHIAEILETKPEKWQEAFDELPQKMHTFSIAGMKIADVKEVFERCNPSLNELLAENKHVGNNALLSKYSDNTNIRKPLDYFFDVYDKVKHAFNNECTKTPSVELINNLRKTYVEAKPGIGDEKEDVAYFTALALLCHHKLHKEPFHSQLVTVMGATYGLDEYKKILNGAATGQGKTLMLALVAVTQIQIRNPQSLYLLTLTDNLAKDNIDDNKALFEALELSFGSDMEYQRRINYVTTASFMSYVHKDYSSITKFPRSKYSNVSFDNSIVLSDEADVLFDDWNTHTTNYVEFEIPRFKPLFEFIYNGITQHKYDEGTIKFRLQSQSIYNAMTSHEKFYFDKYFKEFYAKATDASKANYSAYGSSSPSFDKATGIVSGGGRTVSLTGSSQFALLKSKESYFHYKVVPFCLGYQFITKKFKISLGMSGTLQTDISGYKQRGYGIFDTANFNAKHLESLTPIICESEAQYFNEILKHRDKYTSNGQPTLIVVEHPDTVESLKSMIHPYQTIDGTESNDQNKGCIKTAAMTRFIGSTVRGNDTLGSIISGRGLDYNVTDADVDKKGGMVVINGYPQETVRLENQVKGRTARLDRKGIYQPIYKRSDVEALLRKAKLDEADIKSLTGENANELIAKARNIIQEQKNSQEEKQSDVLQAATENFLGEEYAALNDDEAEQVFPAFVLRFFAPVYKDLPSENERREKRSDLVNTYNAVIDEYWPAGKTKPSPLR